MLLYILIILAIIAVWFCIPKEIREKIVDFIMALVMCGIVTIIIILILAR